VQVAPRRTKQSWIEGGRVLGAGVLAAGRHRPTSQKRPRVRGREPLKGVASIRANDN
jgi:hypothetical protein